MKKQLLTALTSASLLVAGAIATPASALIFGSGDDATAIDANSQLSDLYDDFGGDSGSSEITVSLGQRDMVEALAYEVNISPLSLLQDPSQIDELNDEGAAIAEGEIPEGLGVIEKGGCTADIGCAVAAAGIKSTLVCMAQVPANGGSLDDAEDIANCLQEVDYDGYMKASKCTYGNCPGFASAEQENLYACNTGAEVDVLTMFN